jgi:CRP-like cAMP-binding protein
MPSLPESALFDDLSEPDRVMIARLARRRKAHDGLIVRRGEKASHLFVLVKGRVKYYRVTKKGQEILLWWLKRGDAVGLSALLKNAPEYVGTAEPIGRCELLEWTHSDIHKLIPAFPQLCQNAFRMTLHYLSHYTARHEAIISDTAEQRLANVLMNLAHRVGRPTVTHVEVEITNEQLGKLADVGLFTATRLLSRWQRRGAIAKKRGKILILAPEKLPID